MILPSRAVLVLMYLLFARIRRLNSFQVISPYWDRAGKWCNGITKHDPLQRSSTSCLFYHREFSSSNTSSTSDQDVMVGISPELQSCILRFVHDGSISQEESRSISDALFRSFYGRNLVVSKNTEDMKRILQTSVDSYLTQKTKRRELGRDAIGNPGSYIRSIVKKEIELIDGQSTTHVAAEKYDNLIESSSDKSPSHIENITEDALGVANLRELLRFNQIEPNELNESCLHALSKHPASTVKYVLETYKDQKSRRKESEIDDIASPSAYVMAIMRNTVHLKLELLNEPLSSKYDSQKQTSSTTQGDRQVQFHKHILPKSLDKNFQTSERNKQHLPRSTQVFDQSYVKSSHIKSTDSVNEQQVNSIEKTLSEPSTPTMHSVEHSTDSTVATCDTTLDSTVSLDLGDRDSQVSMEYVDSCLDLLCKLEQPVSALPGVGPKTTQSLHKLGLHTLRDLLWYFPRSFIDRSVFQRDIREVPDGALGTFVLTVHRKQARHNAVPCTDSEGNSIDIVFLFGRSRQGANIANAAKTKLCMDDKMIVSGRVSRSQNGFTIFNPDVIERTNNATNILGIEPVYRLNSGLSQNKLIKAIEGALQVAEELRILPESLPDEVLGDLGWPRFVDAIKISHMPKKMEDAGVDSPARNRLAFEELCIQQAQIALAKWDLKYTGAATSEYPSLLGPSTWRDSPLVTRAVELLPFELNESQMNCLDEIWNDAIAKMENSRMSRLLQGDVGSGKTVIAYLVGLGCIGSRQGGAPVVSLLAPTQLLALQHYQTISNFANIFNNRSAGTSLNNIRVELLTGSVFGSKREDLIARLENSSESDAVFLIGTHALITTDVVERLSGLSSVSSQTNGKGLALSIIDEEQRFGVQQRKALSSCSANTLYMSATPIPRTIGLHGAGLLDVTNLQCKQRNIATTITTSDNLDRIIDILQMKIDNGSRCFWVLPRIGDELEDIDSSSRQSSVLSRHSMLSKTLGPDRVGHIHGRMNIKDREKELAKFADRSSSINVLVSTTIIEVGIDIPDVDILVVENADHFGLSALHQLRGRIGRSSKNNMKCHCILLSAEGHFNDATGPSSSLTRLDILRETMTGEQIAEADFLLRGPGDLVGNVQSGLLRGRAVDPEYHWEMIGAASIIGRTFSGDSPMEQKHSGSKDNNILLEKLRKGKLKPFYARPNASSYEGFALRIMMAIFADLENAPANESKLVQSIVQLQRLSDSILQTSQVDNEVQKRILSLLQSFSEQYVSKFEVTKSLAESKVDRANIETESAPEDQLAVYPTKPTLMPLTISTNRVDLTGDDALFIVLDVETTGLSDESDHIIQIAAKVMGSTSDEDLFSEYILPPIDRIPENIEKLTGITDSFLRYGGYDEALGCEREAARCFKDVFLDFQSFIADRTQGKKVVLIAHNARFDRGMLDGELRRLRYSDKRDELPSSLGEVFDSSVDTLRLFRDNRMWKSLAKSRAMRRPDSFKLGYLYHHVFDVPIINSHNAVGDVEALDRLLMEKNVFHGWKHIANEIQRPFTKLST